MDQAMKLIQSRANPLFKTLMRQFRVAGKPDQLIWLEGPHLCEMWTQHRGLPEWLIFEQSRLTDPVVEGLRQGIDDDRQICLSDNLFELISSVQSHQGVLMVARPPPVAENVTLDRATVILDRVQDPGNVGTILRTCAAAGTTQVICSLGTAAIWSPKVLRSAQGAHFVLQIHESIDLLAVLSQTQGQPGRVPVLAAALDASSSLFDLELPVQAAWIFGHEGQGVDANLLAMSDKRIRIEHAQPAIESLNVASAAAICLFEQWRQHRKTQ
jgi:TrmH family RNA methyltransferase